MQSYQHQTGKFARCFRRSHRGFVDYPSSLDDALLRSFPRLTSEDLDELRALMLANDETVTVVRVNADPPAMIGVTLPPSIS